jgi:hypothetical protein
VTHNELTDAVDQLATPFETSDDVAIMSMKLDAITGLLLRSPLISERLGEERVAQLTAASPELHGVLEEIGGEEFATAAADARDLLDNTRSSLIDFSVVPEANAARARLHANLGKAFAALDG